MDLHSLNEQIRALLKKHIGVLKVSKENDTLLEVCGTIETMQGKKKVDGIYFASVMPKPEDVRFYYFPIYTHKDHFPDLSPALSKMLKGKSCFYLKNVDAAVLAELEDMIQLGIALYQKDGMLST